MEQQEVEDIHIKEEIQTSTDKGHSSDRTIESARREVCWIKQEEEEIDIKDNIQDIRNENQDNDRTKGSTGGEENDYADNNKHN